MEKGVRDPEREMSHIRRKVHEGYREDWSPSAAWMMMRRVTAPYCRREDKMSEVVQED